MSSHPMNVPAVTSDTTEDEFEISLVDILEFIQAHWRILVLVPLGVGVLALAVAFLIPPTYTATTKFLPPQQQQSAAASMLQSLGALGGLAGGAAGLKNPSDQYVAFLKSRSLQDALIDRFKLQDRYDEKYREDARKELSTNALITSGKDGLITIEASDKDPKFSATLANAHVEEFQTLLNRLAVTEAQQRRLFFEKQLLQTKDALAKADSALRASGVDANTLKSSPQTSIETLARLKASITATEIKLSGLRSYLTDNAAEVRQAQNELAAFRAQLAKAEQNDPAPSSTNSNDYVSKYREYKYQETLYEMFARQYELAKVDESREGAVVQVLDKALVPEKKSKPKKALIAVVATLASFFVVLLYLLGRRVWQNIKTQLPSQPQAAV